MKKFKLDGKAKAVFGVVMAIYAGLTAFSEVRNAQIMEDELEDLKEKVAKLEGEESE